MHAGQTYRERRPAAELRRGLSSVWTQRVAPDSAPYAHRTVPHGSVELACHVGSIPKLIGPQTGPAVDVLAPGSTVVGVRFHPGAAPAVLGVPASELVDLSVGADALWGTAAVALGDRIAASPADATAILEAEIAGRLGGSAGPDPLVSEAVRRLMPWQEDDVGSLTSSLYISERQLRRRCRSAIGLAPKVLHRMLRFQGFLALAQLALARGREPSGDGLARLAADAGYADQAHLSRECLRLSGLSPWTLLREAERQCVPSHDHAASYGPMLRARGAAALS